MFTYRCGWRSPESLEQEEVRKVGGGPLSHARARVYFKTINGNAVSSVALSLCS